MYSKGVRSFSCFVVKNRGYGTHDMHFKMLQVASVFCQLYFEYRREMSALLSSQTGGLQSGACLAFPSLGPGALTFTGTKGQWETKFLKLLWKEPSGSFYFLPPCFISPHNSLAESP